MKLSKPQHQLLKFLVADEKRCIKKLQYKLYAVNGEDLLQRTVVEKLETLGLIAQHPYTLEYRPTDKAKIYLRSPEGRVSVAP